MPTLKKSAVLITSGALAAASLFTLGASQSSAQTFGFQSLNPIQKRHVSGLLASELDTAAQPQARSAAPLRARPWRCRSTRARTVAAPTAAPTSRSTRTA